MSNLCFCMIRGFFVVEFTKIKEICSKPIEKVKLETTSYDRTIRNSYIKL